MRTLLLGSITLFTAIQFSGNQLASANTINRVVVFGDSLSDTGNVDDLTFGFAPGSAYYQGRFSNGPVWAERLSQRLGLNAPTPSRFNGYDYAHGGVHSGPGSTWLFFPFFSAPNAGQQIVQHLAREPARGDDLYTVWSGANDFFDGGTDINLVANNMRDHVLALANAGAQHILVANLPLLGETPEYNTGPDRAVWNQRTISYNSALATRIEAIRPTLSANIYFMDVASMLTDVIAHPSNYGLTNVTQAAYDGSTVSPNVDQYLFFDHVHPTARGHDFLSLDAFELVTTRRLAGSFGDVFWSEPLSWSPHAVPDVYSNVELDSVAPRNVSILTSAFARKLTVGASVDLQLAPGSSLTLTEPAVVSEGGTLSGFGTFAGPALTIDGTLSPGHDVIGQMSIDSMVTLRGTLQIDLYQSMMDRIVVDELLDLSGTVEIDRLGNFIPVPGDEFEIASFNAMTGTPTLQNATGFAGLSFVGIETATTYSILASAITGDTNLDANVDFIDLLTVAQNYGLSVEQPWFTGDFDRSGLVDFIDLLGLAQNYGLSFESDWQLALASVPEPGMLTLLALVPILSSRRRMRRVH